MIIGVLHHSAQRCAQKKKKKKEMRAPRRCYAMPTAQAAFAFARPSLRRNARARYVLFHAASALLSAAAMPFAVTASVNSTRAAPRTFLACRREGAYRRYVIRPRAAVLPRTRRTQLRSYAALPLFIRRDGRIRADAATTAPARRSEMG